LLSLTFVMTVFVFLILLFLSIFSIFGFMLGGLFSKPC
jgi:hypothetical protein